MAESGVSRKVLSNVIVNTKYAQYDEQKGRRETWGEIVERCKGMHKDKFPELSGEIDEAFEYVHDKRVMPSMRSAQFAGEPIEVSPTRQYNCSYLPVSSIEAFAETMFLLLGGTGVGYSVQKKHVDQLPPINGPKMKNGQIIEKRYRVHDQIEGWADAVKVLFESYMKNKPRPRFDYRDIRPKGEPLETSGGKAPGPEPLKKCLENIEEILSSIKRGCKLMPLDAHDIQCYIADAVLAGGIRRAATLSLFDRDDKQMIRCKTGDWWKCNPQRARANNSAVMPRHSVTKEEFDKIWDVLSGAGYGEPGFFFSNDKDYGTNPCAEISLNPYQMCNLTEINGHDISSQEELNKRAKVASFIGTLQASYTDFHYLRHQWKEQTEEEALIGVSITGIGSGRIEEYDLHETAEYVNKENERVASMIGINKAARTTCIKPSGTSSLVCGTSSGIHAWHSDYYIRRMRVGKDEPIYEFLKDKVPGIIEDDKEAPDERAVLSFPIKAPDSAITRDEDVMQLLERIKRFNQEWTHEGHRSGANENNVSATVTVKDDEWDKVKEWMWENRDSYTGISLLPYDGGSYEQAPFEEITEEKYEEMIEKVNEVDFENMGESEDNTDLTGEIACGGGSCEVEHV